MEKTGNYIKDKNNVLRKESGDTQYYTVRLHFPETRSDNYAMEEVQKILTETYIRSLGSGWEGNF